MSNIQDETSALINKLTQLGYRFTEPIKTREAFSDEVPPEKLIKAIVLDTETTGLDLLTDKIIELGMVAFEFCPKTGQAYKILGSFNELEDPQLPIPEESTKVHGITDEMVAGKSINDDAVSAFIENARLIIAHNAKFDRQFVEARFPIFQNLSWACSHEQIPWNAEGISSSKLEFLAYRFGFHYEGHRATNDCFALLEVLQKEFPDSKALVMKRLIESLIRKELNISALDSPYNTKDALKNRRYFWDGKVWAKTLALDELESEVEWLRSEVYKNRSFKLEQEELNAKNRFSTRKGISEVLSY